MVFSKKSCWNMIFLVLSGKMIFPFPENMILHLRRKMKDDRSQKNAREYDIFSFQKGPCRDMIFLVLSGKMLFFPENMIFSTWTESERWPSSGNTWKHDIFSGHVRVLQTWCHALLSRKIKDYLIPKKYT